MYLQQVLNHLGNTMRRSIRTPCWLSMLSCIPTSPKWPASAHVENQHLLWAYTSHQQVALKHRMIYRLCWMATVSTKTLSCNVTSLQDCLCRQIIMYGAPPEYPNLRWNMQALHHLVYNNEVQLRFNLYGT
jgi:hypothetical protein